MTQLTPTPDLTYYTALREREPFTPPQNAPTLPPDVQAHVTQFWSRLQAAETAYTSLAQGFQALWENAQHPVEYRRTQAQELLTRTFTQLDAELQAAADHLKAAQDTVRRATTPPLLGSPDVHELKLLNAREEVRTALSDLQPTPQRHTLLELFEDGLQDEQGRAIAYFIGATDAYKRLLRDPVVRLDFAAQQPDLLRRLLPPAAEPYLTARPALDELQDVLATAQSVRHFTAQDNGLPTP